MVRDGPSSEALMWAGMSSAPSSVWVHADVLRDGLVEPGLEVAAHVGRGVLVERQRRAGVADEEVQQPDPAGRRTSGIPRPPRR